MLIDMDITIAYKCSSCGTFDFTNINIFKLFLQGSLVSRCRCKAEKLDIFKLSKNEYRLTVPCIYCGLVHSYVINREELISNNLLIYNCPITNINQCFIGTDKQVRSRVDSFEKQLDLILDTMGYDDYFENSQVMMDTLNKIHEIAEQGKLYCECGYKDIVVSLLPKGVYLKCRKCSGDKFIPAASNNDLKKTMQKAGIYLIERKAKYKYQSKI